ncbi:hypothetical protein G647_06603 [Cladophialophora carrionii CBS 160.54]|uniref:Mid2 domain-containing protein n=1 Tax=Cladophialophora carrionii CBS 160.54 TaxID=1279043 RepID=V9D8A1_9EURO|nr:uncharacterized protein G647_06603 [Cladophialophora carrionii CBS 160.54]ETI22528.1 hypothetical protein G647_06603 [Cladophialophora carrionii CBS 160.54]
MRVGDMPSSLACLVLTALLSRPVIAGFLPDLLHSFEDLQDVRKRCSNPCGYYGQLCCEADEVCYTDSNNQAQCGAGTAATTAAGEWQYYTTTYVQTDLKTVTETFSSYIPVTTLSCSYSLGETPCGNVCCLSGQFCQAAGICAAVGGGSSGYYSSLYTVTTVITNTASAPIRPTSNTLVTVTSIGGATTTQPFVTPVGTDGSIIVGTQTDSGGGLSGGAIAGIVIGVIVGIFLLLLFCACCIFKGLIDGLLAIFGLGPRRRRTTEEEVYVERHSHGGRGRRTWFGTRPARSEVVEEKRRSGWGTAGWMAAGVGALALWLGLKRKNRRSDKSSSVSYDSSYYTDSRFSTKVPPIEEQGEVADRGRDDDSHARTLNDRPINNLIVLSLAEHMDA